MEPKKTKIEATYKSMDTEEPFDIYFYRPIGYQCALLAERLRITPNTITVFSIFIGAFAGLLFYYQDIWKNIAGMLLLVLANILDSTDGQLARMTNNKTKLGRILDGLAGNVWFIIIYVVLVFRCVNHDIDNTVVWIVGSFAGLSHITHAAIADYYRNIHLYFMDYGNGGEFDHTKQIVQEIKTTPWHNFVKKIMLYFYWNYTNQQESLTPSFQKFIKQVRQSFPNSEIPGKLCETFRSKSKSLMKYTNILQFNTRVIALFVCLLINRPFYYFLFDLIVLNSIMVYMILKHEKMSKQLLKTVLSDNNG